VAPYPLAKLADQKHPRTGGINPNTPLGEMFDASLD
jgi:hypothetical protein